jgi:mycothiol synthase
VAPVPVTQVAPPSFAAVEATVARLDDAARRARGHPALGDFVWRDLHRPGPGSAGFLLDERAYAHAARAENDARRAWAVGLVVAPGGDARDDRRALLDAATAHVAREGGGPVTVWVFGASEGDDADLTALGFERTRALCEMRVPLPLGEEPVWPTGVTVRPFERGRDEAAWVAVNNRAFAGHPEQGGWDVATFERRAAEPWFDPSLLLLAFDDAGLAGFDWLRVHEPEGDEPRRGEIYVIGVDPRAAGTGLGRALAVAGLQAVAARGVRTGSLFVAADNARAVALYRSLGFAVHRTDHAYEREVAAA